MSDVYGASTVKRVRRTNAELEVIDEAIIDVLTEEHPATVRSVFYRITSRGLVDKSENGYRLIGRRVLQLRRADLVPYSWITDGTRYVLATNTSESITRELQMTAAMYRRRVWDNQAAAVAVMVEKDALRGVLEPVTSRWDVDLGIMRGYPSESFVYEIAQGLDRGRETFLYQLGDHDPSGVDAWRSFEAKVRAFNPVAQVTFERLAVTPEQIDEMALPTRPTKKSDSRAKSFLGGSVEVDAIAPSVLRDIVEKRILTHLDTDALGALKRIERHEREQLRQIAERWREVTS